MRRNREEVCGDLSDCLFSDSAERFTAQWNMVHNHDHVESK